MPELMKWFLNDNSREAKLARTVAQGVVGVAAAAVTYYAAMAPEFVAVVVCPASMAVLSPIMDYLGERMA
ncbi:hypothetical protein [Eggerthella lenta]|jgi:O-antigen/teichoic acid export membrane protein|uniref:Uncharacterized protein n=1 Tax=Eggerthella lenta (strain ATCC 25559 / DSM 2243 / CCUG 17323 / JCM 9979 / KCTC 3265 / NCTC 11813 / VPI 0255 / 1899 B) TaxID=479437 RepID=C8WMA2_EGGLE|nr:hypothetical protein [Eggerthella lenta]ACV56597.1 hypothetical protein Elen_2646 [Eggerthella lenta DSM 2243]MCG4515345.1 hypothetical protein [Eggerthella lenta]GKG89365.1 hypothetical protein CE91St32_04070 [Gordonibacter pamelaeae]